jgi:hypothetical protein
MNRNWYVIKRGSDLAVVSTPVGDTDPLRARVGWVRASKDVFASAEEAEKWMANAVKKPAKVKPVTVSVKKVARVKKPVTAHKKK